MMHTKEARVKGLSKYHVVKLGTVRYNGVMTIAANQGRNNVESVVLFRMDISKYHPILKYWSIL